MSVLPDAEITRLFGSQFHWVRGFIFGSLAGHSGIDLGAAEGTPVYWFGNDATVRYARNAETDSNSGTYHATGGGNVVNLWLGVGARGSNYAVQFAHLRDISVQEGQVIKHGQLIGHVGHTGHATGSHLHFGVFNLTGGHLTAIDPVPWLVGRTWPSATDVIGSVGTAIADATPLGGLAAAVGDAAKTFGDTVAWLGDPGNWARIFAVIIAAFLFVSSTKMLYDTSK